VKLYPGLPWKSSIQQFEDYFSSKLNLNLGKKLLRCYTGVIAMYGVEPWLLQEEDQKSLARFEKWCWKRMEKISWNQPCEK